MSDGEERSNSAEVIWRRCLAQAQSFIEAAEHLAAANGFPHIIHHLSLLALEEIGKANLIGGRAVSGVDNSWVDKALESHIRKLQWALWTPMTRIDPKNFAEAGEMAKEGHELRLSSLYVDPISDLTDLSAKEIVTFEKAMNWLNLARVRLKLEDGNGLPSGEPDELLKWFLDTMGNDELPKKILLSKPFIDKYHEIGGGTREWAEWARAEIEKMRVEGEEILKVELARQAASNSDHKPRWRAKATLYTPSHSIRPKILTIWNDGIGKVAELLWTGKKDSFDLRLTIDDNTSITELNEKATNLLKLFVACLNLGSIGYFWFQRPGFEHRLFKEFEDLERSDMTVLMQNAKTTFWGGDGRVVALTDDNIRSALRCFLAFTPMKWVDAGPIFQPYFDGLALIAKSDDFISFDEMAQHSFGACLGAALHKFAGWDGASETFEPTFHEAFLPVIPTLADREEMLTTIKLNRGDGTTSWERLRTTKQLVDIYLSMVAKEQWSARIQKDGKNE